MPRRRCASLHTWFRGHVEDLRANPGDDLLSRLAIDDGPDRLDPVEPAPGRPARARRRLRDDRQPDLQRRRPARPAPRAGGLAAGEPRRLGERRRRGAAPPVTGAG
ncbi:hypothetical protein [Nocardioides convexus]|uniref:hypothetical protein n=1 Tax=Nocardioides convexus TaxID=2712224 RepID=UPI002418991D|nr:hypothetical protein [Nocardioides convexus]